MKSNHILFGLLSLVILWSSSVYGGDLATTAGSMSPGTWSQLPKPGKFFVQIGDTDSTLQYFGEGTWDSIGKQVVFLGAPHGGSSKLHIYKDATSSWIEGTQIPGFPKSIGHGYSHNAISVSDRVLGYSRVSTDITFYEYHLDAKTWTVKGSTGNDGDIAHALVYFPERSRWYVADGTHGRLREYNRAADSWSVYDTNPDCYGGKGYYHQVATYNPVNHLIAFGGGNTFKADFSTSWCTMDASGNVVVMPNAPHTLRIPEAGHNTKGSLVTSDPNSGDLVMLTQTGGLYRFDYSDNKWFIMDDSATRPGTFQNTSNNVTNSFVVPIDTYGVIMFGKHLGANTEVWLYKHSAGGGTPPPAPSRGYDTTFRPPGCDRNLYFFIRNSGSLVSFHRCWYWSRWLYGPKKWPGNRDSY